MRVPELFRGSFLEHESIDHRVTVKTGGFWSAFCKAEVEGDDRSVIDFRYAEYTEGLVIARPPRYAVREFQNDPRVRYRYVVTALEVRTGDGDRYASGKE
jgi:hypothetical protein